MIIASGDVADRRRTHEQEARPDADAPAGNTAAAAGTFVDLVHPGEGAATIVELGALKGNVGDQQYEISDDVDIDTLSNAVVWCRAFSVGFTSAALSAS